MVENKVGRAQRLEALPGPGVGCAPDPHFPTFAVFNHTHPHTLTGTTTEASVFGRNSGVGVRVGLEPSCGLQAQSHAPLALRPAPRA